ncbi:MAG: hypothetical protein GKR89_10920 [Candidatus Latescibacteria bacterium]|nr:hypothetical protein [Candidatus Latescibacterota bacterium]
MGPVSGLTQVVCPHGTHADLMRSAYFSGNALVAAAMNQFADSLGADAVLGLGDNFYPDGVEGVDDPQFATKFEDIYTRPALDIPFYMTLGNHDHAGNILAQVRYDLENRGSDRWRMPDFFYRFEWDIDSQTKVELFAVDTQPLVRIEQSPEAQRQLDSLGVWLRDSKAQWKILFGHIAPYSNGAEHGDNQILQQHLVPLMEQYQVDAGFFGHDHHLEALDPVGGVHYFVSGAGSQTRTMTWGSNTRFATSSSGFIWAQITSDQFHVAIIKATGHVLWRGQVGE